MWLTTINHITLYNLNGIRFYRENKSYYLDIEEDICIFVVEGINNLPIFYSFPLKMYSVLLWLLLLRKGRVEKLYKIKIPFFGVLNKLIRSLILLKLFDDVSISDAKRNKVNLIQEQ
jgi:hypothetical protein